MPGSADPLFATDRRRSFLVLSGVIALQAAGPMPPFMIGALAVQVKAELGFDDAVLGLLLASYFLTFALLSLLSGRLVDRVGARRSTWMAVGGTTASLLGIAALGRSVFAVAAFLALAGVAGSLGLPAANRIIVMALPDSRRGLSFGLKMAAVPIATLVAGASVPLIALDFGWRWAMVAVVIFPVTALILQTVNARRFPASLALGQGLGPAGFGLIASRGGYTLAWTAVAVAALFGATFMILAARARVNDSPQSGLRSDQ